jgi:hypothetical protein
MLSQSFVDKGQIVGLNLRHFVSSSINATLPWWIGSDDIGDLT